MPATVRPVCSPAVNNEATNACGVKALQSSHANTTEKVVKFGLVKLQKTASIFHTAVFFGKCECFCSIKLINGFFTTSQSSLLYHYSAPAFNGHLVALNRKQRLVKITNEE